MAEESLPLIAATGWARNNASTGCDPVAFGHNVALVFLAAQATQHHAGDEAATAAALAALSIPAEVRQALWQLVRHLAPVSGMQPPKNRVDAG